MKDDESNVGIIVMAESTYFSSIADKESYTVLGVGKFQVLAGFDRTTCSKCDDMDGKIFDLKDFEVGFNAQPFHPCCICCICPYFDNEFNKNSTHVSRDLKGKNTGRWKFNI